MISSPLSRARVAVSLVFLVNGVGLGLWIPQIPRLRAQLGLDDRALGLALFAMAVGAVVGMPTITRLVGRFGSRRVTTFAALLFCIAMPLPVSALRYAHLAIALFAFGFASGATDVAMNVHASRVEAEMARPVMSSFHGLWSLGALVGSGAASLLLAQDVGGTATMFGGGVALAPVVLVAHTRLLRTPDAPRETGTRARFAFPPRGVLALGLLAVLGMMSEGAVADWSGVFLTTEARMTIAGAGATFTGLSLVATLSRLALGDRAVARWGRRPVLLASAALAAIGIVIAVASPNAVVSPVGFGIAWLGLTGFVPLLFSAAGQQKNVTSAAAMGAVATLGYVGFLIGPPVVGLVSHAAGLRVALLIIPLSCAVVVLLGRRPSLEL